MLQLESANSPATRVRASERPDMRTCVILLAALSTCAAHASQQSGDAAASQGATASSAAFEQKVPGTAFAFKLLPVPGDPARGLAPFWIGECELTWEAFDAFVYRLDEPEGAPAGADAITRPTKPYLPPDRGFGHAGFAAISMSHKNASAFCEWLSQKSGNHFRLPTEKEWEYACTAGANEPYASGADAAALGEYAWFAANSEEKPHAVAKKSANRWGLFDVHGNVAEWVDATDGKPVTKGGSYRSSAEQCSAAARAPYEPAWNRSDPQIPKSKWWLSDGPFVGFRVVCDRRADASH